MPKRMECGKLREATTPIHPSKTANLVPVFAMKDLPLGKTAALMSEFPVKQNTPMMMFIKS